MAGQADTVSLEVTPEVGRGMARRALQLGEADLAARIAAQVLAANPDDVSALFLLTAGLVRSGHADEAVILGRRGFRLAKTKAHRFEAAYLMAEALSVADRPSAAKLWLRRADTYSTGPADTGVLRDAFQKLDARTPLKLSLSFGGGPTDNVNGGSLHDTFDFGGIPIPIAQALPGTTLSSSADLTFRLIQSPNLAADLALTARQRNVFLAPKAQELQPGARNADYLYDSLDLGGTVGWARSDAVSYSLGVKTGRRWLGGKVQSDQHELTFGTTWVLGGRRVAHLELSEEINRIPNKPRSDTQRLAADASLIQTTSGGVLRYKLGVAQTDAEAAGLAYRSVSAGLDWRPAKPILGMSLDLFAQAEVRDYWKTPSFDPDKQLAAGIMARFDDVSLYGFAPTLTISAARTYSQVVVRDISNVTMTLGLSSSF